MANFSGGFCGRFLFCVSCQRQTKAELKTYYLITLIRLTLSISKSSYYVFHVLFFPVALFVVSLPLTLLDPYIFCKCLHQTTSN